MLAGGGQNCHPFEHLAEEFVVVVVGLDNGCHPAE